MIYIIFLEWILKTTGRIVIKLTLALTNTCSSCNSNEGKACWCEAFQLRRSQLAWLDGFQQLFRWKEANQDRLPLWLFAERPWGFSRIPFKCKGWKQTGVSVLSDHDYWRMIKSLFLVRSGGGVHPVARSSPVHAACITSVRSPFFFALWMTNSLPKLKLSWKSANSVESPPPPPVVIRLVSAMTLLIWLWIVCLLPVAGELHKHLLTTVKISFNPSDVEGMICSTLQMQHNLKNKPRCGWSSVKSVSVGACRRRWKTGTTCIKNSPRDVSEEMWRCAARF